MWLRDSSAQVWPYLRLAKQDPSLRNLIKGVINRKADFVLLDAYANAFYDNPAQVSEYQNDLTKMQPGVHERKWEVDSLCYVIRLADGYWKATGDTSIFTAKWQQAMKRILDTFREQQCKQNEGPYAFQRHTTSSVDTQFGGGHGNPTRKIGLIHSMFRSSDDATFYSFLISSNMFAVVSLRQLSVIFNDVLHQPEVSKNFRELAQELDTALQRYAIHDHTTAGKIYALEIDGFGNALFMDDTNVPNLLSLPYLGYSQVTDAVYQRTRHFSLSRQNPWYQEGKWAKGIGGPHVGLNRVWPLRIVVQDLTSVEEEEIIACLRTLKRAHAGKGFIHEAFDVNNPNHFSRSWFAWANTIFGELILKFFDERPQLLRLQL